MEKIQEEIKRDGEFSKIKEHIARLCQDAFAGEVAQEGIGEGMTMSFSNSSLKRFLWRANNYRLKISFPLKTDGTPLEIEGAINGFLWKPGKGSKTIRFDESLTAQVFPSCVFMIYSLKKRGEKAWWVVDHQRIPDFKAWVDEKVNGILSVCLEAYARMGFKPPEAGQISWIRHEDEVKGEEAICRIPGDLIMYDTVFKKVYKEGVEFKSPVFLKNYITNRAIEDLSPEIASELRRIHELIEDPLLFLKESIKKVSEIPSFRERIAALSDQQRSDLTDWIFKSYHAGIIT
ncbi:MAG: hypothetical protein PHS30_10290 [Bacteroidales bacterium]|nr:hypothetical protein [Bacteroidales bacterium]